MLGRAKLRSSLLVSEAMQPYMYRACTQPHYQTRVLMLQDTLLFFYGAIMCVGGIAALGFLDVFSRFAYKGAGEATTNTLIGLLSAVIDNM